MRILFATDGSQGARAAAEALLQLPLELDTTVTVLTVAEPQREQEGFDRLLSSRDALSHCTATVSTELRHGHPAEVILDAAEEDHADLIVLGACGKSAVARFLIGSVAERVARHAHCSVLLVRPGHEQFRRVMIGVSGSGIDGWGEDAPDRSAEVARQARQFPLPSDAEVRAVVLLPSLREVISARGMLAPPLAEAPVSLADWMRAAARERLDVTTSILAESWPPAVSEIRSGDAVEGLVRAVQDEGVDLLVVGGREHGAVERFFFDSVEDAVARRAPCSVLIVRPRHARAPHGLEHEPAPAVAAR